MAFFLRFYYFIREAISRFDKNIDGRGYEIIAELLQKAQWVSEGRVRIPIVYV